jgi:hypothetical protein
MSKWEEHLQITGHPYLKRFRCPESVRVVYWEAALGLSPIVMFRPKFWYGRAENSPRALERLSEMVLARLNHVHEDFHSDLMLVLEECEGEESLDLLGRIFAYQQTDPHGVPRDFAQTASPVEPASEKQRAYLRRLGHQQFRGSRAEASRLIERLKAEQQIK